jgi:CRISPR-associated protein Csy1
MARGRQTSAMLRMLEIPELIATDEDDYVAKAVALMREPARRENLRATILMRQARLFDDAAAVRAFADFLVSVRVA